MVIIYFIEDKGGPGMRKFVSILLAIALILTGSISCAFAETDIPDNLTSDVEDYWFWSYWSNGCFEKGEDPSAKAVYGVIEWYELEALNNDYFVDDEDDEVWCKVPEADYEKLVAKHFVLTDTLKASLKELPQYVDGYFCYYEGGFGDIMPEFIYQGHKVSQTGEIEVYGYKTVIHDENGDVYTPSEDEVEGVDYIYTKETYEDEFTGLSMTITSYMKIEGTLVATYDIDGENCILTSFTEKPASAMPAADELSKEVEVSGLNNIVIDYDRNVFDGTTVVVLIPIDDFEGSKELVEEALGKDANLITVFDISAISEGQEECVQPNGIVKVTFKIPEGYSDNLALYYIGEDGTVELVKTTYNAEDRTLTAEFEHFSTFALVDLEKDATDDGNTPAGDDNNNSADVNKPSTGETATVPTTGDASGMMIWMSVAVLAACVACFYRKKANK